MFQKSHKFKNTVFIFINDILLKLVKEYRFVFAQNVCKRRTKYYKSVLNVLFVANFLTSSITVIEVAV